MLEPTAVGVLLIACSCANDNRTITPVDYYPPANQPIWTRVDKSRELPDEPPVLWHQETGQRTPTTYGERIELAPHQGGPGDYLQQFIPQSTLQSFSNYRFGYLDHGEFDVQRSEFGIGFEEPIEFTGRPASVSVLGAEALKLNDCLLYCGASPTYMLRVSSSTSAAFYITETDAGEILSLSSDTRSQLPVPRREGECLRFRVVAIGHDGVRSVPSEHIDTCELGCSCRATSNRATFPVGALWLIGLFFLRSEKRPNSREGG